MSSDVAVMAKRLEELLAGLGDADAPDGARTTGEELVRTIVTLYGEALERILSIVHAEAGDRSDELFTRLCEDRLVEELLCLHGLHPLALEDRVAAALESVMPYVRSHQGNLELSRIDGDVLYVRLEGSCDGCPGSASTLKLAVERAVRERAPEIHEVRAEETLTLRVLTPA